MCEEGKTLEQYEREFVDAIIDGLLSKCVTSKLIDVTAEIRLHEIDIHLDPTSGKNWRWEVANGTDSVKGNSVKGSRAVRFAGMAAAMLIMDRKDAD